MIPDEDDVPLVFNIEALGQGLAVFCRTGQSSSAKILPSTGQRILLMNSLHSNLDYCLDGALRNSVKELNDSSSSRFVAARLGWGTKSEICGVISCDRF